MHKKKFLVNVIILVLLISLMGLIFTNLEVKGVSFVDDNGIAWEVAILTEGFSTKYAEIRYCTSTDVAGTVRIPNSVTIGSNTYPVKGIGYDDDESLIEMFRYSTGETITSVIIPEGVEYIGGSVFESCTGLQSVTIPSTVQSIGQNVFYNCSNLTSVNIPDGITTIKLNTFSRCSSLESIDIPDSVTTIEKFAFAQCGSLKNVELPNTITTIQEGAFEYCYNLENINIPNNITTIEKTTFYQCYKLDNIDIPSGVTTIGNSAFSYCNSLTNVEIPDSVTSIEAYAFYHCEKLENLTIGDGLETLLGSEFSDCPIKNLSIGSKLNAEANLSRIQNKNLLNINVSNSNTNYEVVDGVLYSEDLTKLVLYPAASTETEYTINEATTQISDYAFAYSALNELHLSQKIDTIGSYAFRGLGSISTPDTSMTNITILNPECAIESNAFAYRKMNITGYKGSTAQTIADASNTLTFIPIEVKSKVVFETNGGIIAEAEKITEYLEGTGATLPITVTKEGYTFAGWYEDNNFSGEAITAIGTDVTGDKTYYAKWEPSTNTKYKVEHYLRTTDMEVESYSLHETENKTGTTGTQVTATAKTYDGFTQDTTHEERVATGNVAADGSLVLKLYYNRNTYNITYELNGGSAPSTLTSTYLYGKELILSSRVEKSGYIFAGWYDNENLSGNKVISIAATQTGDKTFYAKWIEADNYYITSDKYEIEEEYVSKISPNTSVDAFLDNMNTNGTVKVLNSNNEEISGTTLIGTGNILQIEKDGEKYEYEIVVRGDIDGNGKITVTDLSMLNQQIVRRITLTGAKEKAADIEYSGRITVTDLSMMNQALVGRITL